MWDIRRFTVSAIGGTGALLFVFVCIVYGPPVWAAAAPVVITEIGAYEKTDLEWIEIENVSDAVVDMTDWKFWEAETNHRLKAENMALTPGEIAIIAKNDLALREAYPEIRANVFDSSWGSLRESGEEIGLRDATGVLVESFTYIEVEDTSLERKDVTLPDYSAENWHYHPKSNSLGEPNSRSNETEITEVYGDPSSQPGHFSSSIPPTTPNYVDGIRITALLPNPVGRDTDGEYIELTNRTEGSVSLLDWTLADNSSRVFTIPPAIIDPGATLRFFRNDSKLALNNSGGDTVILHSPDGVERDRVLYTISPKEGEVLDFTHREREDDHKHPAVNMDSVTVPEVVVFGDLAIFDASDVILPEETSLHWVIDGYVFPEDRALFQFLRPGTFEAELLIEGAVTSSRGYAVRVEETIESLRERVRITAIMPDPIGHDSDEFIELHNPGDSAIDLSGFILDDIGDGGSKPYSIPEGTTLAAGESRVFERRETKLTLNNTEDTVRLLDRSSRLIRSLDYEDAKEGIIIGERITGEIEWRWTMMDDAAPRVEVQGDIIYGDPSVLDVPLGEVRRYEKGTELITRGIVTVLPGIFGSQYFYIVGEESGLQIYMYRKDFPPLSVGDRIEVRGEVSQSYGETRLKVKDRTAIKKLDHPGVPEIPITDIELIGEEMEGSLITVQGDITEVKGTYVYVDDLTEEIKVYLKRGTGITQPVRVGMSVMVTGIISERNGEYRLLPRSMDDIVISEDSTESIHPLTGMTNTPWWRQQSDVIIVTLLFLILLLILRKKKPSSD